MSFPRQRRRLHRLDRVPDRREVMGQIVVTEFITLDGVIEDPGGSEGF